MKLTHKLITGSLLAFCLNAGIAQADVNFARDAQTVLHMLDYVSVDYGEAVKDGKVEDEGEYKEQAEFVAESIRLLQGLPDNPQRAALVAQAQALMSGVDEKRAAEKISSGAQVLRHALIAAYGVTIAPRQEPDIERARMQFREHCIACHGLEGKGDGPAGAGLDPAPSNFHDGERMDQRSVYGLFNTISLGVGGTGMTPFSQLSEEDRWALAFYVSNLRSSLETLHGGAANIARYRQAIPDLAALANLTANEVRAAHGEEAVAAFAALRAEPKRLSGAAQLAAQADASAMLDRVLAAYEGGNAAEAKRLAIAAYLEGFEPIEASLDNADPKLRREIEAAMMALREQIGSRATTEQVGARIGAIKAQLAEANERIGAGKLSAGGAFASSLIILLREGLEAILVLAAVVTFVIRNGRRDALKYVHAGWSGALVLGALTWVAATWLLDISGAQREITEGVTALLASAMLVYVGLWLHRKTHAGAWQSFLRGQIDAALESRTLWSLSFIAFLAVYREMFETVLFYQALWVQAGSEGHAAILGGMGGAAVLLAVVGWGIFRLGLKLPLGKFFNAMAVLLAVMAVAFAGQGVAALQEAGIIPASLVDFVSFPLLGIFPTLQTLAVQLAVIAVLVFGLRSMRRMG